MVTRRDIEGGESDPLALTLGVGVRQPRIGEWFVTRAADDTIVGIVPDELQGVFDRLVVRLDSGQAVESGTYTPDQSTVPGVELDAINAQLRETFGQ